MLHLGVKFDSAKKSFEPHPPMPRVSRTREWSNGILTWRRHSMHVSVMHLNGSATEGLAVAYRLSLAIDPQ